jgi:4,5-DOPA dioxygenase extradiol
MANGSLMPVVFFGHGTPMNALTRNPYTEAWRKIGAAVPQPKAILSISAHWYTQGTGVTADERPQTNHDFGGFPDALCEFQYPAAGEPRLADRGRGLLAPVNVEPDNSWGFDHGTWSVLAHAFPRADVPVVQLSIDATRPAKYHYELVKRLAPLREEGVLIIGSGNVVHNLRLRKWEEGAQPYGWALRFDERVRTCLAGCDHEPLLDLDAIGEAARLSAPTPDHYLPLLYVIGLQEKTENVKFAVDGIERGSVGMLSVAIGL